MNLIVCTLQHHTELNTGFKKKKQRLHKDMGRNEEMA
jgi:hypothetical protein